MFYLFGKDVPPDVNEALSWLRKAVAQTNAAGFYWMGYMHYNGKGLPLNFNDARRLYEQAAGGGSVGAM